MATTINVFGFLLLSLAKSCRAGAGLEPVCSKFEYEEKLLAKTMRLESKVDGLEDRVSGIESMLEALQQEKGMSYFIYQYDECLLFFFLTVDYRDKGH